MTRVHARSALFDLYGDHLRWRGGVAPVAALVRMLEPLGVSSAAVRTGISRMVRQGWLEPVRLAEGAGYELTGRAERRLDEAHARIYRTSGAQRRVDGWDGRWHLVLLERPTRRADRERVEASLRYLGYGSVAPGAWVAPRVSGELAATLEVEQLTARTFLAAQDGDVAELVDRAWQLGPVAEQYRRWSAQTQRALDAAGDAPDDRTSFAVRFQLVHSWRKFLFSDPALPEPLLPPDWPGREAAATFDHAAQRLRAGADRFVDTCLDPGRAAGAPPGQTPDPTAPSDPTPTQEAP